jgi:hypothetical protein
MFNSVNKNYIFWILLASLLCSCKEAHKDNNSPHKAQQKNTDKSVPENFDLFLKKFNADPAFQMSRVKFPFKIVNLTDAGGEAEPTIYVLKKKWVYVKLINEGTNIIKKEKLNNDTINIVLIVEDTGIHVSHYFTRIAGKWQLNYAEDGSD